MLQVLDSKKTQFLQFAGLSLIDKVSCLKRCAADRATIVTLNGESPLRNKVTARKCRSLETCLLTKDVGNPSNQMVSKALTRWHIPSLDEWCPIELHTHHVVYTLGNLFEPVCRNGIQRMKQFLTDAETSLFQTGYECQHRCRDLRSHVYVFPVDVEEHGTIA